VTCEACEVVKPVRHGLCVQVDKGWMSARYRPPPALLVNTTIHLPTHSTMPSQASLEDVLAWLKKYVLTTIETVLDYLGWTIEINLNTSIRIYNVDRVLVLSKECDLVSLTLTPVLRDSVMG